MSALLDKTLNLTISILCEHLAQFTVYKSIHQTVPSTYNVTQVASKHRHYSFMAEMDIIVAAI